MKENNSAWQRINSVAGKAKGDVIVGQGIKG